MTAEKPNPEIAHLAEEIEKIGDDVMAEVYDRMVRAEHLPSGQKLEVVDFAELTRNERKNMKHGMRRMGDRLQISHAYYTGRIGSDIATPSSGEGFNSTERIALAEDIDRLERNPNVTAILLAVDMEVATRFGRQRPQEAPGTRHSVLERALSLPILIFYEPLQ